MSSKLFIPNDLLDSMVCLNCNAHLSVFPIYTKIDGSGALCGRCKIMEDNKFIRDEAYEGLAQFLIFPCRYVKDGCKENLTPPKLEEHERCCKFRKFDCPTKIDLKCQWKGARANLVEHFEQKHAAFLLKEPSFKLNFVNSQEECFLFQQDEELFVIKKEVDARKGIFSCSVEHLKAVEESDVYNHSLKIESGNKNFFYKCPDKSTCDNERLNSTQLTQDILRERLHDPDAINVNIQIFKTKLVEVESSSAPEEGEVAGAVIPKPIDLKKNPNINWDMLSEMECPVCFDYMLSPIYQCTNGHSICEPCKSRLTECPVCKNKFQETKNFVLEKMTQHMIYPCKFYKSGCQFSVKATEIRNHENGCEFGPYTCPLKDAQNCDWKASHAEVVDHIDNNHDESILKTDKIDLVFNNTQALEKIFLIKYLRKVFKLFFKYQNEKFYWCVQLVGPANDAKLYKFEIDVIDLTLAKKRCYFTGLVVPLSNQTDCFTTRGKYTVASLEQLEDFINNNTFSFRVRVIKE